MSNKLYDETSIQNIANAIRNKNGSSDLYTVGQMAQAILDIPTGDGDGDITWDKRLVEEWDFTKSLEGSKGDTFILTAGATKTSDGIVFDGNNPTVTCDLKNLVDDWTQCGIQLISEYTQWGGLGGLSEVALFGATDGCLFEMNGGAPWNQVFPRDYYSPDVKQAKTFRNVFLDCQTGYYSFNRFMCQSSSTNELFSDFNTKIRDGEKTFCLGGYNGYLKPPSGFTIKRLAIYERIEES